MDPGLLKPVVQTLLQLLKSPRLVTVKHCLRIVSAISNSQRGSEILLEMSTALYLRQGSPTIMHDHSLRFWPEVRLKIPKKEL